jgi:hypothetical protein
MQAAAQTPACRIEPPSRCFQRQTSSMKSREPAMTPPIGAPRPLEKSIQAESHPEVISRAEMPVATVALSSRAPSMWVAMPFALAIFTTSSRSAFFQIVPPPILAVCSTLTTVCGGW